MKVKMRHTRPVAILLVLVQYGHCSLENGMWDIETTKDDQFIGVVKNVYKDTKVNIRVHCETDKLNVTIGYVIRRTPCWEEYLNIDQESTFRTYYNNPDSSYYPNVSAASNYIKSPEFDAPCNEMINIHPYLEATPVEPPEMPQSQALTSSSSSFSTFTQDLGGASTTDVKTGTTEVKTSTAEVKTRYVYI